MTNIWDTIQKKKQEFPTRTRSPTVSQDLNSELQDERLSGAPVSATDRRFFSYFHMVLYGFYNRMDIEYVPWFKKKKYILG